MRLNRDSYDSHRLQQTLCSSILKAAVLFRASTIVSIIKAENTPLFIVSIFYNNAFVINDYIKWSNLWV